MVVSYRLPTSDFTRYRNSTEVAQQQIQLVQQQTQLAQQQTQLAQQQIQRVEILAAKLRELGIDPDTI